MDDKSPTTCAVEGCTELPFYQPAETGGALCPRHYRDYLRAMGFVLPDEEYFEEQAECLSIT